jgi:hypothetical protein
MKVFTTTFLAVALGLWVCGSASAAPQDLHNPDRVAPAPATHQDLRNPDRVAPALAIHQDLRSPDQVAPVRGRLQDLRNPDRVAPEPAIVAGATTAPAPPVASTDALPAPDAGLSTLLIVLISTGGALAVAGAGYATMRVAQGRAAT